MLSLLRTWGLVPGREIKIMLASWSCQKKKKKCCSEDGVPVWERNWVSLRDTLFHLLEHLTVVCPLPLFLVSQPLSCFTKDVRWPKPHNNHTLFSPRVVIVERGASHVSSLLQAGIQLAQLASTVTEKGRNIPNCFSMLLPDWVDLIFSSKQ